MKKALILFLAFAIVASAGIGFSADEISDANSSINNTNNISGINVSSANLNSQFQEVNDPNDPSARPNTIPMQKTGVPIIPALLSTLMIGSGLLYERLRN